MKVKDWHKTTQLVHKRQNHAATTDTSELSHFSLSELPVDQNGPPTLIHGPEQSLIAMLMVWTEGQILHLSYLQMNNRLR